MIASVLVMKEKDHIDVGGHSLFQYDSVRLRDSFYELSNARGEAY